ncbi:MAG: MFS transporter [Proteobacteria bacterium]|nr:MFS transporter [Pseudomonadota bacterium]
MSRSIRSLLRENRDFRRLFLASVVSLGGDWFSFVAVADLVTELTGRPGAAAFVYAATVLPVFLASPIAGVAADRFDRKRILVIADLARVPLALLLCVAAATGSVALAIGAVIALGVGASFSDPVASAATPNLVGPEDLATAQALFNAVWGSMLFVGAGLGGIVAERFGRQAAFAIDAGSFLVSALLVAGIRAPLQEATVAERISAPRARMRDVLAYARAHPLVGRLLFAKVGVSSANGIVGLLPAFARGAFAGSNLATGALLAARGVGALLGPFVARALAGGHSQAPRTIVAICFGSTIAYAAFYAALPITPWLGLALVLVAFAHLGGGAQWVISTVGLQTVTPDRLRGRVMSADYGLATLAIGVSSIAAGILAEIADVRVATWILTAVAAIYAVAWLAWCAGLPELRRR